MRPLELKIKRARGFLLIVAILVLVVIAVAIAALGNMTSADIRSSSGHAQSEQAYFAATSGLEYATGLLRSGTACGSLPAASTAVGAGSFTLTPSLNNPASTTVGGVGVTTLAQTTIPATSTTGYASHGLIIIDGEQIAYTGTTANSFTGATRAYGATPAATHLATASILQNQCTVRSVGSSAGAQRILESAIRTGPWAEYLDGGSVNITSASAATLGSIATSLPAGDNLIIAAVTMENTTGTATSIAIGNLQLRRGAATIDSNLYPVNIGTGTISNNNRPQKTFFFVYRDAGQAAGQTYSVTAQGNNAFTNGEVKMLVISNTPLSQYLSANIASIGSGGQTTITSMATALAAGTNLVIARVHLDNNTAADRTIAGGSPGNLQLRRTTAPATVLASNLYPLDFRANSGARATEEYSVLLIARDSAAPASPTYLVSAQANNTNVRAQADILVIQGVGGASVVGTGASLNAAATPLANLATAFPALGAGDNNVVLASSLYDNTVGATRNVTAGSEAIVFNAANQTTNAFQYQLCTSATLPCDHFPAGLLWRQSSGPASAGYGVVAAASTAASINGQASILAMHLNPVVDRIEIYP